MSETRRLLGLPWWASLALLVALPTILTIGYFAGRQTLCVGHATPTTQEDPSARVPVVAEDEDEPKPLTTLPDNLFKNWNNPDLVLLISGQSFGYLQPCGCSEPQYGGLVRRYNLVKLMEKKGWPVAGIDVGEFYPPKVELEAQAKEKFKTILRAMDVMNYQDYGLGLPEFKMPLLQGLAEAANLNLKKPRPLSLDIQDPNKDFANLFVRSYDIITSPARNGVPATSIGVTSMTGESVQKAVAGGAVSFHANAVMIPLLLKALAGDKIKTDVNLLLLSSTDMTVNGQPVHQGEKEASDIANLVFKVRQKDATLANIDLIIYTSNQDNPPAKPARVPGTNSYILCMGHKAKFVGVLGLFRKAAGGYDVKYELVTLGPEFRTPKGKEAGNPVAGMMQDYADTVKAQDFLKQWKPLRVDHPSKRNPILVDAGIDAKYVGSKRCDDCHPDAYKKWLNTPHSIAYKTLEEVKQPSLRQYDPECVMCHTVGFKYNGGYYDPPVGANEMQVLKHNDLLKNVGCESCHGPASFHVNDPNNKKYYPIINPIKLTDPNGPLRLDIFCQSCHDIENDVHWGQKKPFEKSWKQIAHPTPKGKDE